MLYFIARFFCLSSKKRLSDGVLWGKHIAFWHFSSYEYFRDESAILHTGHTMRSTQCTVPCSPLMTTSSLSSKLWISGDKIIWSPFTESHFTPEIIVIRYIVCSAWDHIHRESDDFSFGGNNSSACCSFKSNLIECEFDVMVDVSVWTKGQEDRQVSCIQ